MNVKYNGFYVPAMAPYEKKENEDSPLVSIEEIKSEHLPSVADLVIGKYDRVDTEVPRSKSENLWTEWHSLYRESNRNGSHTRYCIIESTKVVGITGWTIDDDLDNCAEIYYWIGKQYRGRGYATGGVAQLKYLIQSEYTFQGMTAVVYDKNLYSKKVLKKNGFKKFKFFVNYGKYEVEPYDGLLIGYWLNLHM
ncbi:MAG: GNAT family N-acetyltransferase [Desulfobacterales bacterium]|nr:GNAT family N-acetyltransferase [Desulfobacterales bacterium]